MGRWIYIGAVRRWIYIGAVDLHRDGGAVDLHRGGGAVDLHRGGGRWAVDLHRGRWGGGRWIYKVPYLYCLLTSSKKTRLSLCVNSAVINAWIRVQYRIYFSIFF